MFALITTLEGQEAALMVILLLLCAGAALVLLHLVRQEVPMQPVRLKADG